MLFGIFAVFPKVSFIRAIHTVERNFLLTIVSRGDWLGNPANFKGAVCCLASEVETYHHVTMTLHKLTAVQNNMADVNDLLFFGETLTLSDIMS